MYKWYVKQRLSVKFVLPSILIITLLSIAGVFTFSLENDQRILQKATNTESQQTRNLSGFIESYNQVQSHLYKAVALSFAGQENSKIVNELNQYISLQTDLEKNLTDMSALKVFSTESTLFSTIKDQSTQYFKWVKEVASNLDDPGIAASNMVTTETKFLLLRTTLQSLLNSQETRMSAGMIKTEKSLNNLIYGQLLSTILVAIIALGISLLNLWMFKSFVKKTKEDVGIIADGDFAHKLTVTSGDELGELAMSVEQMRQKIHSLLSGLKTIATSLTNSSSTLHDLSDQLTHDASTVDDRTNVISSAGHDVSVLAEKMAREAQTVSNGSISTARSLEEMKGTIQEISRNCILEVQMAQASANTTGNVIEGMNELANASKEIGEISKIINDIAGKTNLLALNATIEAASAGEAGKGFAVVASEVKGLAAQSNTAAKQIGNKIIAIQSKVTNAISSTREIHDAIQRFSDISSTISAAVEEQSVMVGEIAGAVTEVSKSSQTLFNGMEDVSSRSMQVLNAIKDVGEVVSSTAKEAILTKENSGVLETIAAELNTSISKYKL